MRKQAYLIMAHCNKGQLQKLLNLIDDERNDIYLHVDKYADFDPADLDQPKHSTLTTIERKSVRWAHYSQVDVELDLLQAATACCRYSYYHLLSGQDLPIKSRDYIYRFFDEGKGEFIQFASGELEYHRRYTSARYPLLASRRYRKSNLMKSTSEIGARLQLFLHIDAQAKTGVDWKFYDGATWFSITDDFACYMLSQRKDIEHVFKYAKAPDEFLAPTVAMNSRFADSFARDGEGKIVKTRAIDWTRGSPYIWGGAADDFDLLMQSNCLFARKFDERIHGEIVDKIYEYVLRENKC